MNNIKSILDLSFNKIDDPEIIQVLEAMPNLAVLNLMSNPVISKIQNYRKNMIFKCKRLTFLDDRPVFEKERLTVEAWAVGGIEAEREERQRQKQVELDEHNRNFEALKRLQENARAKRLLNYGPEQEPVYTEGIERLRKEMMAKIEPDSKNLETENTSNVIKQEEEEEEEECPPAEIMVTDQNESISTVGPSIRQSVHISTSGQKVTEEIDPKEYEFAIPIKEKEEKEEPVKQLIQELDDTLTLETEQNEADDHSVDMEYYTRPAEQNEADRSVDMEIALKSADYDDEIQEPLLKQDEEPELLVTEEPKKEMIQIKSSIKASRKLLNQIIQENDELELQTEFIQQAIAPAADDATMDSKPAWNQ